MYPPAVERVRLRIVLDEPDRTWVPGEEIAGRVEVEVDEDVTCSGVRVRLRWLTAGDSNAATGETGAENVGSGPWKGGDRFSFPFRLKVPDGPASYVGKRFSVVWTVHAEAKLAWAFDPEVRTAVRIGPLPAGEGGLVEKREAGGFEFGCAIVCALLLLVPLSVLLFSRGFPGAGWIVAACVGGVGSLIMVPVAVARRRLGEVLVECGPTPVRAGEEFAMRLVVHPRKTVKPKSVRAQLVGTEVSVRGAGKSKKTRSETLWTVGAAFEGPETVERGAEGEWAGVLRVPEGAAPSLTAGPHSVRWVAKFAVDQDWLPEASWDLEVRVA